MDMRISNAFNAYGLHQTNKTASPARSSKVEEKKDMIALSSQAKDFQSVYKALANVPDVRGNLVDEIKSRIENGTYSVSDMDVAGSIVDAGV